MNIRSKTNRFANLTPTSLAAARSRRVDHSASRATTLSTFHRRASDTSLPPLTPAKIFTPQHTCEFTPQGQFGPYKDFFQICVPGVLLGERTKVAIKKWDPPMEIEYPKAILASTQQHENDTEALRHFWLPNVRHGCLSPAILPELIAQPYGAYLRDHLAEKIEPLTIMFSKWSDLKFGIDVQRHDKIWLYSEYDPDSRAPMKFKDRLIYAPQFRMRVHCVPADTLYTSMVLDERNLALSFHITAFISDIAEIPRKETHEAENLRDYLRAFSTPSQGLSQMGAQRFGAERQHLHIPESFIRTNLGELAFRYFDPEWPVFRAHFNIVPGVMLQEFACQGLAGGLPPNFDAFEYRVKSVGSVEFKAAVGPKDSVVMKSTGAYTNPDGSFGAEKVEVYIVRSASNLSHQPANLDAIELAVTFNNLALQAPLKK